MEALAGLLTGARGDAVGRGLWVLALDPRAFGAEDRADRADRLGDDWERAGGRVPGARPGAETFVVGRGVWAARAPAAGGPPGRGGAGAAPPTTCSTSPAASR